MPARCCVSVLIAACISVVLLAQAPALDVKMGLWEVTYVSTMGGDLPTIDTSKMTPQQKAQVDEMMKSMTGAHTTVDKTCMTKDKFAQTSFMGDQGPGTTCKQTLTTNTRTTLESTVTCTGAHPTRGQMHVDALSTTSVKATMKGSGTEQGKTMTMNIAMTGKWLGASCGDVN